MVDRPSWSALKQAVAERANYCCEYCRCQAQFSMDSFSVEHIIPRSRSGETCLDNLALACQGCNNHKYTSTHAFDPVSGVEVALYHPRQQHWEDHFIWDESVTLMIGLTATGRATVEKLRLNRLGVVNLRQILFALGKHPPPVK